MDNAERMRHVERRIQTSIHMDNRKHALIFVTVTVFLDTVGFGLIMPVLPEFLMSLTGFDLAHASAWAGYLVIAYAALQFVFAPIIGNLSDRFGRRPVLLISLVMYGVNYLIAGFATALWVLFIGRVLTGITSATYATANALIADVTPADSRAQNFGLVGMAFGLGFVIGPGLGGLLGGIDLRLPFFFAAGLAGLNVLYGLAFLRETLPESQRRPFQWRRANPVGMLLQVRNYPVLMGLITVMFIYNIGHHVYPSNWSFYTIEKFDWKPLDIGLSMMLVGVLMAFVQGYLIRVVIPRWGPVLTAFVGFHGCNRRLLRHCDRQNVDYMSCTLWCFISAEHGFGGSCGEPASCRTRCRKISKGELQGHQCQHG